MNFSIGNDWMSSTGLVGVVLVFLALAISAWHYNQKDRVEDAADHSEAAESKAREDRFVHEHDIEGDD